MNQQPIEGLNVEAIQVGLEKQIEGSNEWDLADVDMYIRTVINARAEAKNAQVKEESAKFLEENKGKDGVMTTETGLQYKVITEGTGASPMPNDNVTLHYHGTLIDGTVFDSSVDKGKPITMPANRFIPGFTEGLLMMKEGGKRVLYIPSNIGYGDRPAPGSKIPPGSALVFEIELISVQPAQ